MTRFGLLLRKALPEPAGAGRSSLTSRGYGGSANALPVSHPSRLLAVQRVQPFPGRGIAGVRRSAVPSLGLWPIIRAIVEEAQLEHGLAVAAFRGREPVEGVGFRPLRRLRLHPVQVPFGRDGLQFQVHQVQVVLRFSGLELLLDGAGIVQK